MQIAAIEIARNKCGLEGANSTEFDPDTPHPVIDLMADQQGLEKGGTMRLGAYPALLERGSRIAGIYNATEISERFAVVPMLAEEPVGPERLRALAGAEPELV
jgi:CTP synthase